MTLLATFAQLHQISQVASWCYIPTINLTREEMSGKRLCERSLSATLAKFHRPFWSDNSHSFCNTTKQNLGLIAQNIAALFSILIAPWENLYAIWGCLSPSMWRGMLSPHNNSEPRSNAGRHASLSLERGSGNGCVKGKTHIFEVFAEFSFSYVSLSVL